MFSFRAISSINDWRVSFSGARQIRSKGSLVVVQAESQIDLASLFPESSRNLYMLCIALRNWISVNLSNSVIRILLPICNYSLEVCRPMFFHDRRVVWCKQTHCSMAFRATFVGKGREVTLDSIHSGAAPFLRNGFRVTFRFWGSFSS